MEIGGAQGGGSAPPFRVTRAPREEEGPGNSWGIGPVNFDAAAPGRRVGTAAFATDPREEEGPDVCFGVITQTSTRIFEQRPPGGGRDRCLCRPAQGGGGAVR